MTTPTVEEVAETTSAMSTPQAPRLYPRLKLLIGVAALLSVAAIGSVTLTDSGAGTMAAADTSTPQGTVSAAPAPDTKVFKQPMPIYHWHTKCPLADATSLRTNTKKAAERRNWMS